jgi:uncharacterized protein with HEPN domain
MSLERPVLARLNDARNNAREARNIADSASVGGLKPRDCQAIRYCLMVVGEALSQVPADILANEPTTPWRRVIALRHRLVHGYWRIDEDLIGQIARHETGSVIEALERLIEKLE